MEELEKLKSFYVFKDVINFQDGLKRFKWLKPKTYKLIRFSKTAKYDTSLGFLMISCIILKVRYLKKQGFSKIYTNF